MSDAPSAFRQITRTARKAHKCCECRRVIEPDSKYQCSSGIWDGSAQDLKQCINCSLVANAAAGVSDEDEFPEFGALSDWLGNYFHHGYSREQSIHDIARDLKLREDIVIYALNGRFSP
ncbi:hypothetical protein [Erwinia aphidicola]|uniref:hypothetical protein n=1 Tax=Erwinia aphidicola TaxID=68334 RepID=UPI003D1A74FB